MRIRNWLNKSLSRYRIQLARKTRRKLEKRWPQISFVVLQISSAIIILSCYLAPAAARDFETNFDEAIVLPTGTSHESRVVTHGDFNGDGFTDIAVGATTLTTPLDGFLAGDVRIMLGKGNSEFSEPDVISIGSIGISGVYDLGIGDFNGDGFEDLVIASTSLNVTLGNGDGTFGPVIDIGGYFDNSVTVGDFNGDGLDDIATCQIVYSTVDIHLGMGNGKFEAVREFSTNALLSDSINQADLNNDGITDLITNNYEKVSVLLGDGDGNFGTAQTFGANSDFQLSNDSMWDATIGDFNNDGLTDVAVIFFDTPSTPTGGVSILDGNGDGTLKTPRNVGDLGGWKIESADLNSDDQIDLAFVNFITNQVRILINSGEGKFFPPQIYLVGDLPYDLDIADFNNDGLLDIAALSEDSENVTILFNDGILVGDINCDGSINLLDIDPFVALLISEQFDPSADINEDGAVNLLDVQPFANLILDQ